MNDKIVLHLVYCESRMLLTKRRFSGWREIQDTYADYQTSLGPWSASAVLDFFRWDWGEDPARWPWSRERVEQFLTSDEEFIVA